MIGGTRYIISSRPMAILRVPDDKECRRGGVRWRTLVQGLTRIAHHNGMLAKNVGLLEGVDMDDTREVDFIIKLDRIFSGGTDDRLPEFEFWAWFGKRRGFELIRGRKA